MDSRKKKTLRLLCISLGAAVVVVILAVVMFTHTPGHYRPAQPTNANEVSPYLTHQLAPDFHNYIQLNEPFEIVVTQYGLNDIIARGQWPIKLDNVTFAKPAVVFVPDTILLMGTVDYLGLPIVVTIILKPQLGPTGLLSANLQQVRAGALNITFFAKVLAARVIAYQIKEGHSEHWLKCLSPALLSNEPFEPIFPAYGKHIRLTKAEISTAKLTLSFTPTQAPEK